MTHSPVGASSCERWWNCPGSNALIETLPKAETSKYAAEGTAAHAVAEKVLRNRVAYNAVWPASSLVGEIIEVDDFQIKVTEEMAESAELYTDTILQDAQEIGCTLFYSCGDKGHLLDKKDQTRIYQPWVNIEKSFELTDVDKEARGTNDASIQRPGEKLIVYDFKYGKGIPVEATENKQMLYYAIGAAGENLMSFKEIELVIIQPRADHALGPVRRWKTTPQYLKTFKDELGRRIRATRTSTETSTGKWCRFCSAKLICPAVRTTVNETAKADFQVPMTRSTLPKATELTPEEIKLFLDNADILENFIEEIRTYAFNLLDRGGIIKGYKLVKGGKTHRKWENEEIAASMLALEFGDDEIYETKLKSPAKIEKLSKGAKDVVESYTTRPEGKLVLTRDEDLRDKQLPTAISDFADIDLG